MKTVFKIFLAFLLLALFVGLAGGILQLKKNVEERDKAQPAKVTKTVAADSAEKLPKPAIPPQ